MPIVRQKGLYLSTALASSFRLCQPSFAFYFPKAKRNTADTAHGLDAL